LKEGVFVALDCKIVDGPVEVEEGFRLHNGDLIVTPSGVIILITSWDGGLHNNGVYLDLDDEDGCPRPLMSKGRLDPGFISRSKAITKGGTANYCSFINLKTGQKVCYERCSRSTTRDRIVNHLRNLNEPRCKIVNFQRISVKDYSIAITIHDSIVVRK
jgi:hypothetical protein